MKKLRKKPFLFISLCLITTIVFARNPYDVPSQPGVPNVIECGSDWCEVEYPASISDGGSTITSYKIEFRSRYNIFYWADGGYSDKLKHTVWSLTEGWSYEFRTKALNAAGESEPSRPSNYHVAGACQ